MPFAKKPEEIWIAFNAIEKEYDRARSKFNPMRGPHEGYAVLLEEMDELWDDIKANNKEGMKKEIVQVCAMALAFYLEVAQS